MARNDTTVYEQFGEDLANGEHDIGADTFKLAILDNTLAPAAGVADPRLGLYTEVGTAGNYVAGGTTVTASVSRSAGVTTIDFTVNPSYAADASNDADAYWGLVYNDTNGTKKAIAFIDLGGPVDMTAGPLTITINASGLLTITVDNS